MMRVGDIDYVKDNVGVLDLLKSDLEGIEELVR